jgi:hypothetical protein
MEKRTFAFERRKAQYALTTVFMNEVREKSKLYFRIDAARECHFQWYKDGEVIPGANKNYLHLSSITQEDEGDYWAEVDGKRIIPHRTIEVRVKKTKILYYLMLAIAFITLVGACFLDFYLWKVVGG